MHSIFKAALLPLWAVGLHASDAPAQAASSAAIPANAVAARAEPIDPKAAVPAVVYRSSFATYQPFAEAVVGPWRDTNELVRQRGGWRAYAREASQPEPAASAAMPGGAAPNAADPAAARPPASGHSGHKMK